MLLHVEPSPLTRLHRSIAWRYVAGPEAALAEVEALSESLDNYHLFTPLGRSCSERSAVRIKLGSLMNARSNSQPIRLSRPFSGDASTGSGLFTLEQRPVDDGVVIAGYLP
jgi:predicted RNA polymerase sigma factor